MESEIQQTTKENRKLRIQMNEKDSQIRKTSQELAKYQSKNGTLKNIDKLKKEWSKVCWKKRTVRQKFPFFRSFAKGKILF